MSERAALLSAIETDPACDTARLAFADWLDEQPEPTGLDLATASFIRISCESSERGKFRQSKAEGKWLAANWGRLVPSVALSGRYKPRRTGRWVSLAAIAPMPAPIPPPPQAGALVFVRMEFWRGFVRRVLFDSAFELELLLPTLVADQPLVEPDVTYPIVASTGPPVPRVWLSRDAMGAAFRFVTEWAEQNHADDFRDAGESQSFAVWIQQEGAVDLAKKVRRDAFRALAKSYAPAPVA